MNRPKSGPQKERPKGPRGRLEVQHLGLRLRISGGRVRRKMAASLSNQRVPDSKSLPSAWLVKGFCLLGCGMHQPSLLVNLIGSANRPEFDRKSTTSYPHKACGTIFEKGLNISLIARATTLIAWCSSRSIFPRCKDPSTNIGVGISGSTVPL